MSFESGSVSFRFYSLPRSFDVDAIDTFARYAAPPIDMIGDGAVRGWVTSRHLLDSQITEEHAMRADYLCLTLRSAEKKVPTSLLKAECRMEELAVLAADDKPFLNSKERSEIKKSVISRLLPAMPPQLKGIDMVYKTGSNQLYATSVSTKQSDEFCASFISTMGFNIYPVTPELAVAERRHADINDWQGTSFSPDMTDDQMELAPGREFLTWLWYMAEAHGGTLTCGDWGEIGVLIEGPLVFAHEGNGAYETVVRRGEPVNSVEAKTCLLSGKKLRQAKITLAVGEDLWRFTLNADEFSFSGLSLPKSTEPLDPMNLFLHRMGNLEGLYEIFFGLYDQFVEARQDTAGWRHVVEDIRKWISKRNARK